MKEAGERGKALEDEI